LRVSEKLNAVAMFPIGCYDSDNFFRYYGPQANIKNSYWNENFTTTTDAWMFDFFGCPSEWVDISLGSLSPG
jgi:hypothetical protein